MPGCPFIYYGDEIGMRYAHGLKSKEGGYERTGSRTPMQWDHSTNAGFSSARRESLYLPIDDAADAPNVASQETDSDSLLRTVRALNALRMAHPALQADRWYTQERSTKPMTRIPASASSWPSIHRPQTHAAHYRRRMAMRSAQRKTTCCFTSEPSPASTKASCTYRQVARPSSDAGHDCGIVRPPVSISPSIRRKIQL